MAFGSRISITHARYHGGLLLRFASREEAQQWASTLSRASGVPVSSQAAELQRTTSSKLKRTMSAPRNRREISRPYGGVIGQSKPSAAVSSPPKHDAIMLSVSFALGLISPRGEKRKLSTGKYSNGSSQQSSPTHSESPEQFRSKSEPNSPRVLSRHPSASITAVPLTKLVRNRVESRFSLSLSLSLSLARSLAHTYTIQLSATVSRYQGAARTATRPSILLLVRISME